jgi:hypothetical protein
MQLCLCSYLTARRLLLLTLLHPCQSPNTSGEFGNFLGVLLRCEDRGHGWRLHACCLHTDVHMQADRSGR